MSKTTRSKQSWRPVRTSRIGSPELPGLTSGSRVQSSVTSHEEASAPFPLPSGVPSAGTVVVCVTVTVGEESGAVSAASVPSGDSGPVVPPHDVRSSVAAASQTTVAFRIGSTSRCRGHGLCPAATR